MMFLGKSLEKLQEEKIYQKKYVFARPFPSFF